MPQTPENFGHDLDGNLTGDGRWSYMWDAENRLIRMVAATAVGPQQRIEFEYDAQGRRIRKKVWNNTSGTGAPETLTLTEGDILIARTGARTISPGPARARSFAAQRHRGGIRVVGRRGQSFRPHH
jgi:YD repeat-containing protein